MTEDTRTVTVAYGNGIGPEITEATLRILEAASARLTYERVEVGEDVYRSGHPAGISPETWDSLRRTKVFLKGPVTTPQGGGFKSLNVTVRKTLGLFANVRPCRAYAPYVPTRHPDLNLVIVRENEEDLYGGIEHRQTDEVYQCLKLISRPGCERICRYAFDYARRSGRKKVTCLTKDNIMKMTDGLFRSVFEEVGRDYPDLEQDHLIIDIGTARMADTPERFDVVVVPNLYGDILSDVAAQVAGSVGMAGSANIGDECAMFEAIHGSAPDIAGKGIANPSGMLNGALLMLLHVGQADVAERIENAWLKTLEDGVHTADVYREGSGATRASTSEFADAVVARLGRKPEKLTAVRYGPAGQAAPFRYTPRPPARKVLEGVDVFVHCADRSPDALADRVRAVSSGPFVLSLVTNRGVKVWPEGFPESFCTDHWRCRFSRAEGAGSPRASDVWTLLSALSESGVDVVKCENLYSFDGVKGYSAGQGAG